MASSIKNCILTVPPHKMLLTVVKVQRENVLKHKKDIYIYDRSVHLRVEQIITTIIKRKRPYQKTIMYINSTVNMEATAQGLRDPPLPPRRSIPPFTPQTITPCCAYSRKNSLLSFFHEATVIIERFSSMNRHRSVD